MSLGDRARCQSASMRSRHRLAKIRRIVASRECRRCGSPAAVRSRSTPCRCPTSGWPSMSVRRRRTGCRRCAREDRSRRRLRRQRHGRSPPSLVSRNVTARSRESRRSSSAVSASLRRQPVADEEAEVGAQVRVGGLRIDRVLERRQLQTARAAPGAASPRRARRPPPGCDVAERLPGLSSSSFNRQL